MRILIVLALVFGLGGCLGQKIASPEVEFVEVTKIKTVKEPAPPPERVVEYPDSCLRAMEYSDQMSKGSLRLYSRGRAQKEITSDARIMLATNSDLNEVYEQQDALTRKIVGDLQAIVKAEYRYELAREKCEEELK